MTTEDRIRLSHMLDAARKAQTFVERRTREDLDHDPMLAMAIMKALEIIGEAATRVSGQMKAKLPDIPWPQIGGMRHHLVHAYHDIDADLLWDTATLDLLPLIAELQKVLRDDRGN